MIRYIRTNNSFWDFEAWAGGADTLSEIKQNGKMNELEELFDDLWSVDDSTIMPTETDINDWLWFDRDYIFSKLGIIEEYEEK